MRNPDYRRIISAQAGWFVEVGFWRNVTVECMTEKMIDPIFILIVEDSPADARLLIEMLKMSSLPYRYHLARDGEEALEYLANPMKDPEYKRPDLILLDLNLPKKDGRKVLQTIKEQPETKAIPVLVLSTSASESDVIRCYELHANCYLTKPNDLADFGALLKTVEAFWVTTAKLPRRKPD